MGRLLNALFNPSKNTNKAYSKATAAYQSAANQTNPFYQQQLGNASAASSKLADLLQLNGVDSQRAAQQAYMTSPGYDFQFAQGTRAIDNSGAARGMSQSGAQMKALQQYGQGLYAQDFGNYLSRLASMQQGGYGGASGIMNNAGGLGDLYLGAGQARDAGNAGALGNVLNIAGTAISAATGMPINMGGGQGGGQLQQLLQARQAPTQLPAPQGRILYGTGTGGWY